MSLQLSKPIKHITPGWYKLTYLQNRNRVTDVENKLMVTKGESGGGINWEIGIDICTLLYIK